jgi:hypothetical protein
MPPIDLQSNKQLSETGQPSADQLNWSNRSSDDHTWIAEQLADQIFDPLIDELRRVAGKVQVKARKEFRVPQPWLNGADVLFLKADRLEPPVVMPVQLFADLAIAAQRVRL